ncbi:MAG: RNA 2',3'-cyclic phosphodiesterase [Deltaproteobacteria bacterium]|nr:RNA 2',3'-cyclic phosphodiesterase [Deltaproteobacteria bacterium]
MRIFIAVGLPLEIVGTIAEVEGKLKTTKGRIAWVKPENSHLTLRFLGEVEEGRIKDIHRAMLRAIVGIHTFSILLREVGVFPSINNPRVLWIGTDGGEQLGTIYDRLEEELEGIGIEKERRRFHPHVTIGRVRHLAGKGALLDSIERLGEVESGKVPVEKILLFRSDLQPSGAVHTILREARLGE